MESTILTDRWIANQQISFNSELLQLAEEKTGYSEQELNIDVRHAKSNTNKIMVPFGFCPR